MQFIALRYEMYSIMIFYYEITIYIYIYNISYVTKHYALTKNNYTTKSLLAILRVGYY